MATYKTIHQILIEKVPGGAQLALPELIEKGRPYIFNFNYDIVPTGQAAEDYKKYFETEFLIRYFNREISRSNFDLWDLKLYGALNNIMPYYNELIKSEEWFSKYIDNPANNTDYKEEYTRDITSNTTDKNTATNKSKNKTKTEANTNTATKDKGSTATIADAKTNDKTTSTNEGEQSTTNNTGAVGSQFPQSMLDTLADYATEASKTDSTVQGTSNSKTEQANNTKTSSSSNETNESENTTNTYESGTIGTDGTIQSESENNSDGKSKETYTFRRYGNIGVQTPGEVFESTRKAFINTLEMILTDKRIRDLFLQVPTNEELELGGGLVKMKAEQIIKAVTATVTTGISLLFGQVDTALTTLFVFMAIDIVTGLLKAVYNENLSSEEMHRGAIRKMMKLMIVIVGVWMDKYTGSDIFRLGTIGFMIGTEGLSIFENVGQIIELPEYISKYFEQLKNNNWNE